MSESYVSKKDIIKKRRLDILNDLLDRPYTEEELQDKYGIKRKTLKDDITYLKENGFDIPKHSKKNGGYNLSEQTKQHIQSKLLLKNSETLVTEKLRNSDIPKTLILLILQKRASYTSLSDIVNEYTEYLGIKYDSEMDKDEFDKLIESIRLSIKNTIDNNKNGLIKEGLIESEYISKKRVYRVTKKSPYYIAIDKNELADICYSIKSFGASYILQDELVSIYNKLALLIDDDQEHYEMAEIVSVGNIVNRSNKISKILKKLESVPYDTHAININWMNKQIKYKVGIIVYVADKDKVYMIGRHRRNDNLIIDLDDVSGQITSLEDLNDIYRNEYYINIYEEMFSLSVEPVEHVIVEFTNYGRIYDKFSRLASGRPKAVVRLSDNKKTGIYEDDIRGISDFSKYLRRFGRSVKIIAPEKLKQKMIDSLERLEEVYAKEHEYE